MNDKNPIIKGGCGHSDRECETDGICTVILFGIFVVSVFVAFIVDVLS